MRPFLGIDLTVDKRNEQIHGEELLIARPSAAIRQAFDNASEKAEQTIERASLPCLLQVVQWLTGGAALLIGGGILEGITDEDGVTLQQAYQNASWLFWIGGACLLIWGILAIWSFIKRKTVLESDASTQVLAKLEGMTEAVYADLSVPKDAREIDILSFCYKRKEDAIKPCEKGLALTPFENLIFRIYRDEEMLYLANLEGKYAFPLSGLKSIQTVQKNIRLPVWNKEEKPTKGVYKKFKLSVDDEDCVHCKPYHILELEYDSEVWGIYFPCYELPEVEALTGLRA